MVRGYPPGVLSLGPPRRCRPVQVLLVPCLGPPSMSYKVVCRWLPLVLGLEVPRRALTANQVCLSPVLGLGLLSKRFWAHQGKTLLVWGL